MPPQPTPEFLTAATALNIEFEPGELDRLGQYLELLLKANETTNLTAIRDINIAWMRHILDSLTLIPLLADLPPSASVIDVGSGGGLPGIPLAITMPQLSFTLLEATGKKAAFLKATVEALGLTNARVIADRAETLAHDRGQKTAAGRINGHREAYDAVVARAVGRLHVLAELTIAFAKNPSESGGTGGQVFLIKGQQADTEVAEAAEALHMLKARHDGTLDTPTGRIIMLSKGAATPKIYPRYAGEPNRAPLGAARERPPAKPASSNHGKGPTTVDRRNSQQPAKRGSGGGVAGVAGVGGVGGVRGRTSGQKTSKPQNRRSPPEK